MKTKDELLEALRSIKLVHIEADASNRDFTEEEYEIRHAFMASIRQYLHEHDNDAGWRDMEIGYGICLYDDYDEGNYEWVRHSIEMNEAIREYLDEIEPFVAGVIEYFKPEHWEDYDADKLDALCIAMDNITMGYIDKVYFDGCGIPENRKCLKHMLYAEIPPTFPHFEFSETVAEELEYRKRFLLDILPWHLDRMGNEEKYSTP